MITELTLTQFALIVGIACGFIFGLIPLILGFVKKNIKFGLIGFVLSILAGSFLSLLGVLPVVAVFIWLILRNPKPAQFEAANENPTDVSINENSTAVSVNDSETSPENQVSGD